MLQISTRTKLKVIMTFLVPVMYIVPLNQSLLPITVRKNIFQLFGRKGVSYRSNYVSHGFESANFNDHFLERPVVFMSCASFLFFKD
jgi:hypothetical protein